MTTAEREAKAEKPFFKKPTADGKWAVYERGRLGPNLISIWPEELQADDAVQDLLREMRTWGRFEEDDGSDGNDGGDDAVLENAEEALSAMAELVEKNAVAHGFRPAGRQDDREAVAVFVANEHGEVSELWEAFRAGSLHSPCDKSNKMLEMGLPRLSCAEEELADVVIRAMDTAKALGVDIGRAVVTKFKYNVSRPYLHGNKKA